jgi:xylulokinase
VMTNCIFGAYAAGDVPDVTEALKSHIVPDASYRPDPAMTARYRKLYDMRRALVAGDMKAAFHRMVEMRTVK